jgi:hypothetical protein
MGDDSHVIFDKEFLGQKGNVRWCDVVMQQPFILSPKSVG